MTQVNDEHVKDFLHVANRMIEFLEDENDALMEQDYAYVKETVKEKNRLSLGYEKLYRKLAADPTILSGLPEPVRDHLRETALTLDRLLYENGRLLEVKIKSNMIVVNAIAEAARAAQTGPGTYSPDGEVGRIDPRAPSRSYLAVNNEY